LCEFALYVIVLLARAHIADRSGKLGAKFVIDGYVEKQNEDILRRAKQAYDDHMKEKEQVGFVFASAQAVSLRVVRQRGKEKAARMLVKESGLPKAPREPRTPIMKLAQVQKDRRCCVLIVESRATMTINASKSSVMESNR